MTILSVIKSVCTKVGVSVPQSVFANIGSNRTMQELVDCANEMAQSIAYDTREWTMLKIPSVNDGADGQAEDFGGMSFPLPANYKRMLLNGNVWRSTSAQQPMRFISDHDEWLQRRLSNTVDSWGEWIINYGRIFIHPALMPGTTITYLYLEKNCIALASGGHGDEFQSDLDTFRLDERLLRLDMIWKFKQQKGSPYAEEMGSYSDALAMVAGADKPSPILIGGTPISSTARVSAPWPVGWGAP